MTSRELARDAANYRRRFRRSLAGRVAELVDEYGARPHRGFCWELGGSRNLRKYARAYGLVQA